MGNSVLQSGASLGAVLTPLIVLGILHGADPPASVRHAHHALGGAPLEAAGVPPTAWPLPFFVIGAAGTLWVIGWLALVRRGDLAPTAKRTEDATGQSSIWSVLADRRFLVLLVTVTMINTTWQLVRAWLPKFLIQGRDYSESHALLFNSAYYIAADVGCLAAGGATLWLARRGVGVHRSRALVFGVCALLTSLTAVVAVLPAGWPMLLVLLLIAAGSLGLFPCYYSFTQELSTAHMGKVTGLLGAFGWFISAPTQTFFGRVVDQTGSFDVVFGLTGLMPLLGLAVILLGWRRTGV
jgi:ACS family hexuronate transporter-like MFS transporter